MKLKGMLKNMSVRAWKKFKVDPVMAIVECFFLIALLMAVGMILFNKVESVIWTLLTFHSLFLLVYMNVRDLKEWGRKTIGDLVDAAGEVDRATERFKRETGGRVSLNGKDWK